jgi:hypothetical protein
MFYIAWSKAFAFVCILQCTWPILALAGQSYTIEPTVKCAEECTVTGRNVSNWSIFPLPGYFEDCIWAPALFTFDGIYPTSNLNQTAVIKACIDYGENITSSSRDLRSNITIIQSFPDVETSFTNAKDPSKIVPDQAFIAGTLIKGALLREDERRVKNMSGVTVYAHYGNSVVGVWIGNNFDIQEFANRPLDEFIEAIRDRGIGQSLQNQLCNRNSSASATFGIIADTSPGVKAFQVVRNAVMTWSQGHCASRLATGGTNPGTESKTGISQSKQNSQNWEGKISKNSSHKSIDKPKTLVKEDDWTSHMGTSDNTILKITDKTLNYYSTGDIAINPLESPQRKLAGAGMEANFVVSVTKDLQRRLWKSTVNNAKTDKICSRMHQG